MQIKKMARTTTVKDHDAEAVLWNNGCIV
jgi:hypothetical protein